MSRGKIRGHCPNLAADKSKPKHMAPAGQALGDEKQINKKNLKLFYEAD